MASRKEQKEALRREREEREAAAKAAERRRRLIGYGAGVTVALAAVIVGVLLLGGGSGGADDDTPGGGDSDLAADILPDGGSVPEPQNTPLIEASQAAGCELKSYRGDSREHSTDIGEKIEYESMPPTSGRHFQVEARDDDYEQAPDTKRIVHSLEHGRVVIWFKKDLPREVRADLKALYDEDTFQMLLTPDETGSPYEVAATAWNRDPVPNGTGRLMGCEEYSPAVFEALRAFKDEHRSNGPEAIP